MKSILDPTFRYTPSTCTDIARTFARIRSEMGGAAAPNPAPASGAPAAGGAAWRATLLRREAAGDRTRS